ncbi:MAG: M42 family metallopeptidase [Bacteroidales bacterium]|nr:M42 family metallopeptidase [Bacteroidales bacterium]
MNNIQFNLLKKISETPGAPGFEKHIRNLIIQEVNDMVDECSVDNMGNVVAYKKGKTDKKVMLAAHMDEIGFIVSHIDEQGFVRFVPLGGFDPKTLTSQRVIVHGKKDLVGVMGTKPVHMMTEEEKKKMVKTEDFFIDLGMKKEEIQKYVQIGDPITRERELIEMGDCINGKSLDNRISVFVVIETLRELAKQTLPCDIYAVFTVQEEVGIRGAQVATQQIEPDYGFAVDTTIAYDVPGAQPHENVSRLGGGVAVKILDSTAIADYRMVEYMKEVAGRHNIKWQPEVMAKGGTDTAMVQRMTKSGSIAGAVSIPTRHIHQVIESVHKEDIQSSIDLLKNALLELDQKDWTH